MLQRYSDRDFEYGPLRRKRCAGVGTHRLSVPEPTHVQSGKRQCNVTASRGFNGRRRGTRNGDSGFCDSCLRPAASVRRDQSDLSSRLPSDRCKRKNLDRALPALTALTERPCNPSWSLSNRPQTIKSVSAGNHMLLPGGGGLTNVMTLPRISYLVSITSKSLADTI